MVVIKDVERTWAEMADALEEAGLAVFPVVPEMVARADWPDADWRRFLAVAQKAGSDIVYFQQLRIDEEEVAHFQQEMFARRRVRRPLAVRLPDEEPNPEELAIIDGLERHNGEVFEIAIGFANEGVLHVWTAETAWWAEVFSRAMELRDQQEREADVGFEREGGESAALAGKAKEEKWASRVAEDPRFLGAPSRRARVEIAYDLVPELKQSADGPRAWAARGVVYDVVIEAEGLAESDVKPRLTRLALQNLAEMSAELGQDPEWDLARTKDARSTIVKRFLKAKYGFVMPTVVDQLASRKS